MANQPDYVNSAALATMIALTSLATAGAALAITALVRTEQDGLAALREEPMSRDVRSLRAEQERQLNADPAWVDREKGLVSLPIEKAMELTLQDIRRGRTVVGARKAEDEEAEETDTESGEGTDSSEEGSEDGATEENPEPPKDPAETSPAGSVAPGGQPTSPGTSAPGAPETNGQQSGRPASPRKAPAQGSPAPSTNGPPQGAAPNGAPAPQGAEPPQEGPGR